MRNAYESEVGHFEGAVCPDVNTFREEIDFVEEMLQGQKEKNIVMYCTGGIRCEKAGPFMEDAGFENVLQLDGGGAGAVLHALRVVHLDRDDLGVGGVGGRLIGAAHLPDHITRRAL